jgi:para-nitrobenzyl esterase
MIRDGEWNKVPLLLGSNKDEGLLFVDVMFSPDITNDEYYDIIKSYVGPVLTPVVYAMYPPIAYGGAGKALGALIGDMVFTCPTQNTAVAASYAIDTYAYLFSHTPSWVPQSVGAYHGSEVPSSRRRTAAHTLSLCVSA